MPPAPMETARLRLRAITLDDVEPMLAMDMDPEVGAYLYPHGRPAPEERRQILFNRVQADWPERGGMWAVEWKQTPGFLGWCGMFPLEQTGLIEIGYRYITAAWGRGVASEAAARVLDTGFRDFGFDPIVAVTHPGNVASQKVLSKIGLVRQGLRHHYNFDCAYFSLERDSYLAGKGR